MRDRVVMAFAIAWLSGPADGALAGFVEDFNLGLGGWGGGASLEVVPSGGVGGAGDGYLLVSNTNPAQLATRNSSAPYTGDLLADGVTGFSFWLRDLGGEETLRLHLAVGNPGNFWTTAVEFSPSAEAWTRFEVDLTDPGAWVRQQGAGTFEEALRSTDRIQFRNNPLSGDPLPLDGVADFAIDRIRVIPAPGTLWVLGALAPLGARRRRSGAR
ncbi:MAG: hypothetical protein ACIARR_13220 [Phycisphaerales bacterium JB059]